MRNNHVVEPYKAALRDEVETWSERLSDAGYYLGHFGKWHVSRSEDPGAFGFDEYEYRQSFGDHREEHGLDRNPERSVERLIRSCTVSQEGYGDRLLYGTHTEPEGTRPHHKYTQGIEFVRDASERQEPWCLAIETGAPHDPFLAPEETYDRYDDVDVELPANFDDLMDDKPALYRRLTRVWDDLSREEFVEALTHYYAFISHVDDQIGRLLDALEETGQLDDTVVIFTSDHGDMAAGHRLFTHNFTAFEELYNSPLVIRWPDVGHDGQTCDDLVQVHDIAPTIVDIAEAGEFPPAVNTTSVHPRASDDEDLYQSYRSTSLVPFLSGETPDGYKPEAYAEFEGDSAGITQRIYWSDQYKYVLNYFSDDELYNLEKDPAETMNLADDARHGEVKREMVNRIWEIARDTGDYTLSTNHYWTYRIAPVGPDGPDS